MEISLKHGISLSQKFKEVSFSRTFVRGYFSSVTLPLRLVLLATNLVSLCTLCLPLLLLGVFWRQMFCLAMLLILFSAFSLG